MSAIADFRIIETSLLDELQDHAEIKVEKKLFGKKTTDKYWDFLNAHSRRLMDFKWSGHVFSDTLTFLDEKKGINLVKGKYDAIATDLVNKRQASVFILTYEQKQKYLDKLKAENYSIDELTAFNKKFSEQDDPELAKAEIEAIKFLRDNLELLTDDKHVVLLNVA